MPVTTSIAHELRDLIGSWSRSQHRIIVLAGDFADTAEWAADGAPTAAHWLADTAGIEVSTARDWIRVGRALRDLPASADAFAEGRLSYAKVRALTRIATADNESELVAIAAQVPAGELGRTLAAWVANHADADELAEYQHACRSVRRRQQPDGMVVYTMHLPPLAAGHLDAHLTTWTTQGRSFRGASADAYPTIAQQHADAVADLVTNGSPGTSIEVVLHVRGDGCALDDGTPIPDSQVAQLVPGAFIRALVHDAARHPIAISHRRRHPTTRQKRFVKESDRQCVDCGRTDLLEYDHEPPYEQTGHTTVDELSIRCGPCHRLRHRRGPRPQPD